MIAIDSKKSNSLLDDMRESRNNTSVYKVEVSSTSSDVDKIVITVEGKDDPGVYRVWLKHFLPDSIFRKINFTKAGDKKKVLDTLKSTIGTGKYLGNIYFVVDHDFNGNLGVENKNLLVLDSYSIENYIFNQEMVFELLECDFHIEDYALIDSLSRKYHNDLLFFLSETIDLNFLIYYAVMNNEKPFQLKKEKQDFSKHLEIQPNSVGFKPNINIVHKMIHNISTERVEEILGLTEDREVFNSIQPMHIYYRGKFIEGFFDKWIEMLIEDSKAPDPILFPSTLPQAIKFCPTAQKLSFYASKVRVPPIIQSFFTSNLIKSKAGECVS